MGQGSWGKIVIYSDSTVVKIPKQPGFCTSLWQENNIIKSLKDLVTDSSFISFLSTSLQAANHIKPLKNYGEMEVFPVIYDKNSILQFDLCLFSMDRLYPPTWSQLASLVKPKFIAFYSDIYEKITKPYFLFLGRIGLQSVKGGTQSDSSVASLPLSHLQGVAASPEVNTDVLREIEKKYAGRQVIVSHYLVDPLSVIFQYGKAMYKIIWDAFIRKRILLYDVEFVVGNTLKEQQSTKLYLIDCNLCKRMKENVDIEVAATNDLVKVLLLLWKCKWMASMSPIGAALFLIYLLVPSLLSLVSKEW